MTLYIEVSYAQNFYKNNIAPKNQITLGSGPSVMYSNTGGRLRTLGFKILPSLTAAYSYQVHPHISLRGSGGVQWIQSNLEVSEEAKEKWGQANQAFAFQGQTYYMDVMPLFQLFPARHLSYGFNIYAGIGLGIMHANTNQHKYTEHGIATFRRPITTTYAPFRGALGKKINESWELILEGSLMVTFSDDMDGNTGKKFFKNDHLAQGQIMVKRYY